MPPSEITDRERRRAAAAARVKTHGRPDLPEWPPHQPRPTFASEAEEAAFLNSYSFAAYWKRLARQAPKRAAGLSSVVRLRLKESERALLVAAGRERGLTTSELLRELINSLAFPPAPVRIEAGANAPVSQLPGGPVVACFTHLNVVNQSAPQSRVRCWVRFFRQSHPTVSLFPEEMPARWASAPLPVQQREQNGTASYDPYLATLGHLADFARNEVHAVAVALKLADGRCFGWSPESYSDAERERWALPAEPLLIEARVRADGRDCLRQFALDASATPDRFGIAQPMTAPPSAAEREARFELNGYSQGAHLKVISGGK